MRRLNPNLKNSSSILRITLAAGLILFVLTGITLTAFYLIERNSTKIARQQDSFFNILREYDVMASEIYGTEREFARLNRELDKLEKMAVSVESWLSILKRRRMLSQVYPFSLENYNKSIEQALTAYPASQPLSAIAAEALVKNTAINRSTEENLRQRLAFITDPSFNSLRLGLHVLLGDFGNPQRTALIPEGIFSDGTESINIDLAIMKILREDIQGAAADIQSMLLYSLPSFNSLTFAAEFYYDFGDFQRSAEIFSYINTEKAMIRQADALYLAGFEDSARAIWRILADSIDGIFDTAENFTERSLYNLAVTSEYKDEAAEYLKRLIQLEMITNTDSRQFAMIRYSRLLPHEQAVYLLEMTEGFHPAAYPFIDLELCRRQSHEWSRERQLAETWLLLDRHPENEYLYRWAAWMFLFQRNYNETKILLNRMEFLQFTTEWKKIHAAIQMMFEGDIEAAEELLHSIHVTSVDWSVYANLGRIKEAQRAFARALEQYEMAFTIAQNPRSASRIQQRIARCLTALGRHTDAILALISALEIYPDNLSAKLELDRMLLP